MNNKSNSLNALGGPIMAEMKADIAFGPFVPDLDHASVGKW